MRTGDYQETLRGHRVLHLVGKSSKPATMPITVPILRARSLPRRTCGGTARPPTSVPEADRPPRRRPDGPPHRQDGRHPAAHKPALPASRRDHQRTRRRRPLTGRADPRPARRPPHHRAPRPGPRRPRSPRRPLPHRLRRRRLAGPPPPSRPASTPPTKTRHRSRAQHRCRVRISRVLRLTTDGGAGARAKLKRTCPRARQPCRRASQGAG